jgi:glutaredoxin 3
MSAAFVQKLIAENQIVVFSKSYCGYSSRAKRLLDSKKLPYVAIELDNQSDGADIQSYLIELTGHRTVPNIFINQKHIGGCDDLTKLNSQGLLKL